MYESEAFRAVCGVSPSVWFEGWDEYVSSHSPKTSKVYLSLGKKEEKTKNKTMARVGDRIREQHEILSNVGIKNILEWNEGGHFNDPGERCAKGFIWCLNNED
jgi:predicted alpha/beta superfamily hydrolase